MNYYFSPSTRGFYNDEVHGSNIPNDCITLTKEQWLDLLDRQSTTKNGCLQVIDGVVTVAPYVASDEELRAGLRLNRNNLLATTDAYVVRHRDQIEAGVPTTLTQEQYVAVQQYRMALRNLPEQAGFPQDVTWPVNPLENT